MEGPHEIPHRVQYLKAEGNKSFQKALFRRAKAALGLCNIRQALCDLRKATRIDPHNIEIVQELQKIESIHSQYHEKRREVHSQANLNKRAGKRPTLEADPSSEKKRTSTVIGTPYYESTPTSDAKADPIAKAGKVQHDDGQVIPEKLVPPDVTSMKSKDYFMRSAPTFNGNCATRNVVYKPIGHTTRRRSLKLLCLSEAAYQQLEQGNSLEFFDNHTKIPLLASESSVADPMAIITKTKALILTGYVARGRLKGQGWKTPHS
ncbi:hypothetical protein Cgig2_017760 [Carnegiea gigantea]|uniref:Uncharacterized protein n=1 Tax=Carnegiea gigantea TaxID=171969 RepID=A0A9Q1KX95_9CARY|nr:hypothetical protein Cgig2_017760 [Carnegiea gigantea]